MRSALPALAAVTLALTACSSSPQEDSTAAPPVPTPVAASTDLPAAEAALPIDPPTAGVITLQPGATVSVPADEPGTAAAVPPAAGDTETTGATPGPSAGTSTGGTAPRRPAVPARPAAPVPGDPGGTADPPAGTAEPRTAAPGTGAPRTAAPSSAPAFDEEPEDPLAPRPPLETAPPTGQPTCRAADLTVTDADAVYTSRAVQELFTVRTSGPDCQLSGYPAVQLRGADGPLRVRIRRGGFDLPTVSPTPVALSRSTSVSFFVATARDAGCPTAAGLVVTLPGTSAPRTARTAMQVCSGEVGVSPLRRVADDE